MSKEWKSRDFKMNYCGGFRIILNLQSFFDDRRRKSYYYVDTNNHKSIKDIKNGIKERFNIFDEIELVLNDCWLPDHENIRILHDEEEISIIDVGTDIEKKKNTSYLNGVTEGESTLKKEKSVKKKKKLKHDEYFSNSMHDKQSVSIEGVNDFPVLVNLETFDEINKNNVNRKNDQKKRRKRTRDQSCMEQDVLKNRDEIYQTAPDVIDETCDHVTNVVEEENRSWREKCIDLNCASTSKITQTKSLQIGALDFASKVNNRASVEVNENDHGEKDDDASEFNLENVGTGESFKVRKQRRRRRRKKVLHNVNDSPNNNLAICPQVSTVSTKVMVYENCPKHIKFVDDEQDNCTDCIPAHDGNHSKSKEGGENVSIEQSNTLYSSDSIKLETHLNCHSSKETTLPTYEACVSSVEPISKGNSSLPIFVCKRPKPLLNLSPEVGPGKEIDFTQYPLLKNSPRANDIIAFKKWKMDDNYCPNISEYISAKVIQASECDSSITLNILSGHSELKEPQGKFSLTCVSEEGEGEEVEASETVEILTMNLNDLLEMRIIYP